MNAVKSSVIRAPTPSFIGTTGSTWQAIQLTGTVAPGQYYLVAAAAGTGGNVDLPTAQATGGINLSATTGKVALVNSSTLLTGSCPSGLVDFVGYGNTDCAEGTSAATLTNTTALLRAGHGCTDTDNNGRILQLSRPHRETQPR